MRRSLHCSHGSRPGLHRRRQHGQRRHRRPVAGGHDPAAIVVVELPGAARLPARRPWRRRWLAAAPAAGDRRNGRLGGQAAGLLGEGRGGVSAARGRRAALSLMAGIRSDSIAAAAGTERVVRAMPNTPALIGPGHRRPVRAAAGANDRAWSNALAPTGRTLGRARGRPRRGDRAVGLGPGLRLLFLSRR